MAEAVVNFLIKQLATLLTDELKLLGGVRQGVADITDDLRSMTAFLKDADTRQDTEEGVKEWVRQVREVTFHTEDVLDKFILQIGAPHDWPGFKGVLRRSTRFIKQLRARRQTATEIQAIKLQIGAILQRKIAFSFNTINQDLASTSHHLSFDPRVSALFVQESELVGIDNIRNEMVKKLTHGESKLTVISVVGEGGVGKTTLVRKVYESPSVKLYFGCYAWISVSQSFKAEEILRSLIKQHYKGMGESLPEGMDTMNYVELVETLRRYLVEKRYVIILDDIWSVEAWDVLKYALPENQHSSRIIVTTRMSQVAFYCSDSQENVHPFMPLPPSYAWELFCKKTFGLKNGGICPPHLEGICQNIVRRCGGLPLAIVAIGGLLSKKTMILSEWELVHRNIGTEIETNDTLKSMSRILWLSYNDLPYHLKSCFLFFSHFPEDYTVKRARLTRMCVAEGFIKPEMNRTPEEIAEANLNDLVRRSLIQVSKVDCYGRVNRCRVHDLIHDLILRKSEEENFCTSLGQENIGLNGKARRLSITNGESVVVSEDDCRFFSSVRSMFMLGVSDHNLTPALLSSFRLLKVLTLKGWRLERFPSEITNLFHLRYLNMRRTGIRLIPNSIGKLRNLQTLDLKYTHVKELPQGILKLKELRNILVFKKFVDSTTTIHLGGVKIPARLGDLIFLQKVWLVDVNEGREVIKELGKLRQLRTLGIDGLRREDGETLCDSIANMNHLQSLFIRSAYDTGALDVQYLSKYSLPLLRSITLVGPLSNLTNLMPSFENLVKLALQHSRLRDDPLKSLQYLPSLSVLILVETYEGEELSCEGGGFPSLKVLHLEELVQLRCVRFEEGAMPVLEQLCIGDCRRLEEVPIGIERLTSLKYLELGRNSKQLSEIIGREGGEDGDKVKHIPLIRVMQRSTEGRLFWKEKFESSSSMEFTFVKPIFKINRA